MVQMRYSWLMFDNIQHLVGIQTVFRTTHQLHHLAQLLQSLFMYYITPNQVLAQSLRGPDAELSTTPGVDTVSYGKNHVQIVKIDRSANRAGTFLSNY